MAVRRDLEAHWIGEAYAVHLRVARSISQPANARRQTPRRDGCLSDLRISEWDGTVPKRTAVLNPRYVLLTVLYCAGIFGLSSSSNPIHVESQFPGQDKVAHAVLYGGLATVVSLGIRRLGRSVRPWTQFIAPLLFASMYGITDEIHQMYVPGRTPDTCDVLADVLGACIAQIILCRYVWRLSMR